MLALKSSLNVQKSVWTHERTGDWWDRIVMENFRMWQDTFLYLCQELKPAIERQDTVLCKAISVEQRVAITLWKLATNSEYRTIAHHFGVSQICVCNCKRSM